MNSTLISKVISGTSGILSTVNQIIPLYDELKPIIKGLISFKEKLKNINISKIIQPENITTNKKAEENTIIPSSTPQFFQ